jgi:hypothetical protein
MKKRFHVVLAIGFALVSQLSTAASARAAEESCADPVLRSAIHRLMRRDQILAAKQTRLIDKARRLADQPDLMEKLSTFEAALSQRANSGLPTGSIDAKRPKLETVAREGRQSAIIARIHARTQKFKQAIQAKSSRFAAQRKEAQANEGALPDKIVEVLGSYQSEQLEVQKWIVSFRSSCLQVAWLKSSAGARRPAAKQ